MAGYFDKPHHWRMRADMTRTIAAGMVDPEARKILLSVAADYERMAQRLETDTVRHHGRRSGAATPVSVNDPVDMNDRLRELQRKWRG